MSNIYPLPDISASMLAVLLDLLASGRFYGSYHDFPHTDAESTAFDAEMIALTRYLKQCEASQTAPNFPTKYRVMCKHDAKRLIATIVPEGVSVWCMYERVAEIVPKELCLQVWHEKGV